MQVFDYLETNGTAYIVMELLSGRTLEERIVQDGRLKADEVDRILWPLLDGLEQVHAAGFLHRDIKPANILLDAAGNPTLIDFGASRAAMAGRSTALTAIFTPGYAAAEQMTSAKQGPWTDIYGLAATLYHAIAGKTPPSAFDRMLDDTYEPLSQLRPAGFSPGVLAGIDAGLAVVASDRPQSIAGWRPILGMTAAPAADATVVIGKAAPAQAAPTHASAPSPPMVSPAKPAGGSRVGLWVALGLAVLALGGGGAYFALAPRGPDPETVRARQVAEEAEAKRLKAEEEAARLRAENERRQQAERDAADRQRREEAEAAAKKQFEDDTRRKIEAELAAQKKADEDARRKAEEDAERQRKAAEDTRKAAEFVSGAFDHFGPTMMMIGLKDRSGEIRLQGVDIVNDPDLQKVGAQALAAQPRDLRCRQTDRLTDGTPLYRCLITPLNAKAPLAEVPDSERVDLALALVRNGLVLASCDAPRSYADAEDEARGRKQALWGRVSVQEYKRRCTK